MFRNPKSPKFPRPIEPLESRRLLAAVPQLVADLSPRPKGSDPSKFVEFNGALYFHATHHELGRGLWRTDGTRAGTTMVQFANPAPSPSETPVAFKGSLYFPADTPELGRELWRTDGTPQGAELVIEVDPGPSSSNPVNLTVVGDNLLFTVRDTIWKTDGTPGGTTRVKDINPAQPGGTPFFFSPTVVGDTLFFLTDDGVHGRELWKSDGTEAGTALVKD